jgi:hypothetical protein
VNEEEKVESSSADESQDDFSVFEDDFKQKVVASPSSKNLLKLNGTQGKK